MAVIDWLIAYIYKHILDVLLLFKNRNGVNTFPYYGTEMLSKTSP